MSIPTLFNPIGTSWAVPCLYLETDGEAFIDLGFDYVDDYTFSGRASVEKEESPLFGSTTSATNALSFWVYKPPSGTTIERYSNAQIRIPSINFQLGIAFNFSLNADRATVNNNQFTSTTTIRTFTTEETVKLFRRAGVTKTGTRFYLFKIARPDGSLKMDLVPMYNTIRKEAFMFDLVSRRAFYNAGSGHFNYELA